LESGIYGAQINDNSPAAQYGIKEKDVLLEVDGIELNKMCDLRCYIYMKKPKDEVSFKVLRNHREIEIQVTLTSK